jgi:hypothetical protein
MKILRKLRYYCDHCKKSGGQPHPIQKHEAACTMNPARICGMCKCGELDQPNIETLIVAARAGLKVLNAISGNCPACMMAGIRQGRKRYPDGVHKSCDEWDYKEALTQFWKAHPVEYD